MLDLFTHSQDRLVPNYVINVKTVPLKGRDLKVLGVRFPGKGNK